MKLSNQAHLAYCTNVHRGNSWQETFDSLENYVMKVREGVAPEQRFAIGLRLGADAAKELADPRELYQFRNGSTKKTLMFLQSMVFPTVIFMVHGSKNRFTDPTGPLTSDWIIPCCSSLFSKNYWNQARKAV